jgi:hypothetical protein
LQLRSMAWMLVHLHLVALILLPQSGFINFVQGTGSNLDPRRYCLVSYDPTCYFFDDETERERSSRSYNKISRKGKTKKYNKVKEVQLDETLRGKRGEEKKKACEGTGSACEGAVENIVPAVEDIVGRLKLNPQISNDILVFEAVRNDTGNLYNNSYITSSVSSHFSHFLKQFAYNCFSSGFIQPELKRYPENSLEWGYPPWTYRGFYCNSTKDVPKKVFHLGPILT